LSNHLSVFASVNQFTFLFLKSKQSQGKDS